MKRLSVSLLMVGLLSSSVYAKQIAYCKADGLAGTWIKSCWKYTNSNEKEIKNVRTLGGMYSQGWRLITVATHSWNIENKYSYAGNSFFYFEK